jgi:hypothetical protein
MYLDNFKEKHDDYEDLGEGRTFKSPLPIDQIQLGGRSSEAVRLPTTGS